MARRQHGTSATATTSSANTDHSATINGPFTAVCHSAKPRITGKVMDVIERTEVPAAVRHDITVKCFLSS